MTFQWSQLKEMEVNLSFIKTKKSPFPFPTMRKDLPRSNVIANLPKHVGTTNSLCGDQIQCGKMALVQGCLHFFSLGATFKMTNGAFPLQSGARFKRAVTSASVKVIYLQGRPCPKSCGEALCVASGWFAAGAVNRACVVNCVLENMRSQTGLPVRQSSGKCHSKDGWQANFLFI